MSKRLYIFRYILIIAAMFGSATGPAAAQIDAQGLCAQYNLTNVDCACVSKRYDAYISAAQTPEWRAMVASSYRYALGAGGDYVDRLTAMHQDLNKIMDYQQRFESIRGSEPANIDDFFAGCAIKGAPLTPLPALSSVPIHQKIYKACMDFYPDQRSCQCQSAQIAEATTIPEAKAYYYSFNEKGNGSFDEERQLSAQKAGLSLEDFSAADKRARSKIGENYKGPVQCGILRWADGREGRTAEERAGVPLGFENFKPAGKIETMADIQREQQDAAAFARQQAADFQRERAGQPPLPNEAQIKALIASAEAEQAAMKEKRAAEKARGAQMMQDTSPRALFDKGCANADNSPSLCACLGGVFDTAVKNAGASKGAATQLAVLMVGNGLEDSEAQAIMRSTSPADTQVAGQMLGQSIMGTLSCQ